MTKKSSLDLLFKNKILLSQALTHRSWVNEHKGERDSNERLEFLGDAVLELVVSEVIFNQFPDKEEGYLTALRASLVNTQNLAKIAEGLNLGEFLFVSKGEEGVGGRKNSSLLADTVEAVIGALYLDQGMDAAKKFIMENFLGDLSEKIKSPLKDSKSMLQEYVQNKGFKAPTYRIVKASGPDHAKTFEVEVLVNGQSMGVATGASKSIAAQAAAKKALLRARSA